MNFTHCRGYGRLRPAADKNPLRMGRFLASVLAIAALGVVAPAHTTVTEVPEAEITSSVILPAPGQTEVLPALDSPIKPGEYLKFAVNWGIINGGNAEWRSRLPAGDDSENGGGQ